MYSNCGEAFGSAFMIRLVVDPAAASFTSAGDPIPVTCRLYALSQHKYRLYKRLPSVRERYVYCFHYCDTVSMLLQLALLSSSSSFSFSSSDTRIYEIIVRCVCLFKRVDTKYSQAKR